MNRDRRTDGPTDRQSGLLSRVHATKNQRFLTLPCLGFFGPHNLNDVEPSNEKVLSVFFMQKYDGSKQNQLDSVGNILDSVAKREKMKIRGKG